MRTYQPILIVILLFINITAIHFQRVQPLHEQVDSELQKLKLQQSNFETSINKLINNITAISNQVNQQQNKTQKIALLENAIVSERETIFQLSNSIVPPFNMSKNACNQLTNDQKINLLDQVDKIKLQLSQFKLTAASLPQNDQLNMINRDITKQGILIDSIQKIAYTKCQGSIILSPTIFQSNIYASNWILGNQTIDDLIEEYYQRSVQYNNVTNCPLDFPFFNGQQCINCTGDQELFNMYTKKCDSCPTDTSPNVSLRICQQVPHYSDFTKTNNFNLDGVSELPVPDPTLTPCPAEAPFYNGTCVNCLRGLWWSVRQNKCKACEKGLIFDKNVKECIKPSNDTLTLLQGTRWVTGAGNQTKVLQQRANLVQKTNASALKYCSQDSPYFDGIQCISCDKEFNLNSLKCTQASNGTTYDDNLHSYVTPDLNKQTDPKAANLLSSSPIDPATKQVCNASNPFFDGIACIKCPEPFILFNVDTKKCVACAAQQKYNASTHKCQKRGFLKISTNFNRLMGTPTKSIQAYKAEVLNTVQNNKDLIVQKCSNDQYYSNYTACFPCKSNQYFNVQTKACAICNGTFNTVTSICVPPKTYLTNLNTSANLILGNKTLPQYQQQQKNITGATQYCPAPQPYASGSGSLCINCNGTTPYFNIQTSACTACPVNQIYDNVTKQCVKPTQVSNAQALLQADNIFEKGNFTLNNLIKNISAAGLTIKCNQSTPAFNGVSCYSCNETTFYSLQTNTCIVGRIVSNITELKLRKNVKETDNYTLANLLAVINNKSANLPEIECKSSKPLQVGSSCINCDQFQQFDLKNGNCTPPTFYTNTSALKNLSILQTKNYTLANIQINNNKLALPKKPCPSDKPLYNNKECIGCFNKTIYNLEGLNCINATQITNIDALQKSNYVESGNSSLKSLNDSVSRTPPPVSKCNEHSPLFNGKDCISCPNALYDLSSLSCYNCSTQNLYNITTRKCQPKPAFYPNLNNNNWTVNTPNGVLAVIAQVNSKKNISANAPCPIQTPFYNNKTLVCSTCPNHSYYNYDSLVCLQCPANQQVDQNTHECKAKLNQGLYQTNLNSSNLLYGGLAHAQHQDNYDGNKTKYPAIQDCPAATPMYDGFQCIKCFDFVPYFNLVTRTCQNCPEKAPYDTQTKDCLAQNEVVSSSPNIAKMYSTIFG